MQRITIEKHGANDLKITCADGHELVPHDGHALADAPYNLIDIVGDELAYALCHYVLAWAEPITIEVK